VAPETKPNALSPTAPRGGVLRSAYTNASLYELVAKAAKKVRPNHPEKTSTRQFDGVRALIGHPDAPSARWIAKRLGKPWPEVGEGALDGKRKVTMTDSAARRPAAEKWLDLRNLHFALRYVARERGEDSFTANEYETTRQRLLQSDKHRVQGDLATILPSALQLIQTVKRLEDFEAKQLAADAKRAAAEAEVEAAKTKSMKAKKRKKLAAIKDPKLINIEVEADESPLDDEKQLGWWNKCLVRAGLKPHEFRGVASVEWPKAISLYIDACGLLPWSAIELRRFTSLAGFALATQDRTLGAAIAPYLPAVAALRSGQGLPMVDEVASKKAKPSFDLSVLPADLPKSVAWRGAWADNPDAVINALCEYLDTLGPRHKQAAVRSDYVQQQSGHTGEWPAATTLGNNPAPGGKTGFAAWIKVAEAEWQKRHAKKKAA